MAIQDYYNTLRRRKITFTSDGYGGQSEYHNDDFITGYITAMSGAKILVNSQIGLKANYLMYTNCPDLQPTHRVIDEKGNVFEVVFAEDISGHHYEVKLQWLQAQVYLNLADIVMINNYQG